MFGRDNPDAPLYTVMLGGVCLLVAAACTGNGSGSLLALVDGKFAVMRVPYPLGFHAKGLDGRIDDPKAGWKGRGVWSTYATRALTHIEGGKGTHSKAVKFQLRPNPLAK